MQTRPPYFSIPSAPVAVRSGPASPQTATGSDVLPPAIASSNVYVASAVAANYQRPVLDSSGQSQLPGAIGMGRYSQKGSGAEDSNLRLREQSLCVMPTSA